MHVNRFCASGLEVCNIAAGKVMSAEARFVVADSGKVAYGVRVSGDSLATIALGSLESNRGADMEWFFTYPDTTGRPRHIVENGRPIHELL